MALAAAGCESRSYPSDRLKESLSEICRTEYGIDHIEVKIAGDTIGVYLPLDKLFATDFKGSVIAGKVRNLETLFEPSPEAMDKVEDVLFSISRVLLSTDKNFKFYVLQATDVENTGLQLVLKGYVDDVKRVRVWDISREEYRKRVIHEMKQNRAVLWHRPVRQFFDKLQKQDMASLAQEYFGTTMTPETLESLFFKKLAQGGVAQWDITDMRSARVQRGEVLVYVKAMPKKAGVPLLKEDAQYLFLVSYKAAEPQILRIIPFQYLDEGGNLQKIPFPEDIKMEQSLETWEQEFPLEEINLGDFLAESATRRSQMLIATDERIQNTFQEVKASIKYEKDLPSPHFSYVFDSVVLRDPAASPVNSIVYNEDMVYLLDVISRDFVDLLRSYQFGDYEYLSLHIPQEQGEHIIARDALELFRKKKVDFQGLLNPSPSPAAAL
jgi:hypothetical protein